MFSCFAQPSRPGFPSGFTSSLRSDRGASGDPGTCAFLRAFAVDTSRSTCGLFAAKQLGDDSVSPPQLWNHPVLSGSKFLPSLPLLLPAFCWLPRACPGKARAVMLLQLACAPRCCCWVHLRSQEAAGPGCCAAGRAGDRISACASSRSG